MKCYIHIFCCLLIFNIACGQEDSDGSTSSTTKESVSGFKEYYPIHVKPSLGYLSNISQYEDILFDAKPVVYYSVYNNMKQRMQSNSSKIGYAAYATFQPHIRMYSENSLPVKTPSYKILLGFQGLIKTKNDNFFAFALESGHYSNGQSGCSFAHGLEDETDECAAVHATIDDDSDLSALLNRSNGNFSTNITKLSANFRLNDFDKVDKPYKIHSFTASWEWFHNNMFGLFDKGGYTPFDISIYGRHRFALEYEYIRTYPSGFRQTIGLKGRVIQGAHPFVKPFRGEIQYTFYPFPFNRDIGLFITGITGHDNYNYRFVDARNQISIGVTWDWFTPFEIKRAEQIRKGNI